MKYFYSSVLVLSVLFYAASISAQNVGIGTTVPAYKLDVNGEVTSRSANAFRLRGLNAAYSVLHRNDGTSYWQLLTDAGDPDGSWNTLRPYRVVLSTGDIFMANSKVVVKHDTGFMGVGGVTAPAHALDVNGDARFQGNDIWGGTGVLRVHGGTNGFVEINSQSPTYGLIVRDQAGTGYFGNIEVENNALVIGYRVSGGHLTIEQGGNVGIGLANPTAKLEVAGAIKWGTTGSSLSTNQGGSIELRGAGGTAIPFIDFSNDANIDYDARIILNGNNRLTIDGAQVEVLNTLSAKRMKVTATGYPDYVFYDDYELKSLKEVQQFIDDKGHLPGVPSEKEIVEKGLDLNDQSMWQQEKIEELFLHMIENEQRVDDLVKEVADLKKENEKLKAQNKKRNK